MTSPAVARTAKDGSRVYPIRVDGVVLELPSVNSVNKVLEAAGLNIWKLRTVAKGIALHDDLRKRVMTAEHNRIIDTAITDALDRDNRAAERGTEVHTWCERLDREEAVLGDVPYEIRGYCAAYLMAVRDHDIEHVAIERTVFNATVGYAGTFDRIQTSPTWGGVPVITDLKTGKGIYPEVALQLAAYAHGEGMWDSDTQSVEPMPAGVSHTLGVVIHLAADHYELIPIDIAVAWPSVIAITQAWRWRARVSRGVIGQPYPTPLDPEFLV